MKTKPKNPQMSSAELEMKIYGLNACEAIFKSRPSAIIRVYLLEQKLNRLKDLIRHCVDNKLAYHVCTLEEIEKVSGATHHEGVCMVIRKLKRPSLTDLRTLAEGKGVWLGLENVSNPHNLGAIVRSAAHFGVKGIFVLGDRSQFQNGAFYRTAEGGAEACAMVAASSLMEFKSLCEGLGLEILGTSSHEAQSLYEIDLPQKCVFLLGAEGEGLSREAQAICDQTVVIKGTGVVESLNVSVASALCVGEWVRYQNN